MAVLRHLGLEQVIWLFCLNHLGIRLQRQSTLMYSSTCLSAVKGVKRTAKSNPPLDTSACAFIEGFCAHAISTETSYTGPLYYMDESETK